MSSGVGFLAGILGKITRAKLSCDKILLCLIFDFCFLHLTQVEVLDCVMFCGGPVGTMKCIGFIIIEFG